MGFKLDQFLSVNTLDFSDFNRLRLIGSIFQSQKGRSDLPCCKNVFDANWVSIGSLPAMMTPRPSVAGDPNPETYPIPSIYQAHTKFLLRNTTLIPDHATMDLRTIIPVHLHDSFDYLHAQLALSSDLREPRKDFDQKARPFAAFIAEKGEEIGLRFPNGAERLKALGLSDFLIGPPSSERTKYCLTGNAFHSNEIFQALGHGPFSLASLLKGDLATIDLGPLITPAHCIQAFRKTESLVKSDVSLTPHMVSSPFCYIPEYDDVALSCFVPTALNPATNNSLPSEHEKIDFRSPISSKKNSSLLFWLHLSLPG